MCSTANKLSRVNGTRAIDSSREHTVCAHTMILQNTLSRVNGKRAIDSSQPILVHTCSRAVRTVCAIMRTVCAIDEY